MPYCNSCGANISKKSKFCSECGDINLKNIQNDNSSESKINSSLNIFLKIIGVLGYILVASMILQPIFTENKFVLESAYLNYIDVKHPNYAAFIGTILGGFILPFLLVYIGFRRLSFYDRWAPFILIVAILLVLYYTAVNFF